MEKLPWHGSPLAVYLPQNRGGNPSTEQQACSDKLSDADESRCGLGVAEEAEDMWSSNRSKPVYVGCVHGDPHVVCGNFSHTTC